MITTERMIRIFDDTGSGDDFSVSELLYEDNELILCNVFNEWYEGTFKVMIYKENGKVFANRLNFYYAENI